MISLRRRGIQLFPANASKVHIKSDELKSKETTCRKTIDIYLENASLHGLKYLGDRSLTWFERIFFAFIFSVVMFFSVYYTVESWTEWVTETTVTMSSDTVSITELAFPEYRIAIRTCWFAGPGGIISTPSQFSPHQTAVTICNMNLLKRSAVAQYPSDSTERIIVEDICLNERRPHFSANADRSWSAFVKVLKRTSQPCNEMAMDCYYGGRSYNCSMMFMPTLTDAGLCCTFNSIPQSALFHESVRIMPIGSGTVDYSNERANKWNPEIGFRSSSNSLDDPYSFPRSVAGSGPYAGLYVVLNTNSSEFYCSSSLSHGFRVLIHKPHEQPRMTNSLLVPAGQETNIIIKPFELATRDNARQIAQKYRKCLYQDENPLKYHRTYSSRNCIHECEMDRLRAACNCSMYFMAQLDNRTIMCGKSKLNCVMQVIRAFAMKPNTTYSCRCQPSCWDLSYESTMSMAPILRAANIAGATGIDKQELVALSVFFTRSYYRQYNRNPAVSFTDFLSNVGGLLGLFLGFSIVSLPEFIYFILVRPYCDARRSMHRVTPKLQGRNRRTQQKRKQQPYLTSEDTYHI